MDYLLKENGKLRSHAVAREAKLQEAEALKAVAVEELMHAGKTGTRLLPSPKNSTTSWDIRAMS